MHPVLLIALILCSALHSSVLMAAPGDPDPTFNPGAGANGTVFAHAVQSEPRSFGEIVDAHQEYFDKTWYVRRVMHDLDVAEGAQELHPDLVERVQTSMRAIEERYGKDNLLPADEWEWGYIQGKLSALRWVLGDEWDFLDT